MKSLCYSLQRAGTVSTHLILDKTSFPICYFSFWRACCEINCKVCLIISIKGSYLPSTETALVCMCSKCILYCVIKDFYILEKHSTVSILYNLCIFLQSICSEIYKISIIIEKYRSWSFLVVATITRTEHFDSNFAVLIWVSGGNSIS